jgi:toxin ParE1/3/4
MAAANDLEQISDYLNLHHPSLASSTVQKLYKAALSLKKHPYIGRIGRVSGTRELVLVPLPYLIVYAVDDQSIQILRLLHASQDRP